MPADATVDPDAIEPIAEPSRVLDVDMFSHEEIVNTARRDGQLADDDAPSALRDALR